MPAASAKSCANCVHHRPPVVFNDSIACGRYPPTVDTNRSVVNGEATPYNRIIMSRVSVLPIVSLDFLCGEWSKGGEVIAPTQEQTDGEPVGTPAPDSEPEPEPADE